MPIGEILYSEAFEGSDIWTLARPAGPDNVVLLKDDVTKVDISIFDVDTPTTTEHNEPGGITLANVMETSLQTDGYWTKDATGYTLKHRVTFAEHGMEGGHSYRVEYDLTTVNFGKLPLLHIVKCRSLSSL